MTGRLSRAVSAVREAAAAAYHLGRDAERTAKHQARWDALPDAWKQGHQWLGSQTAGCFATHNVMEACDFSCTACYLGKEANQTPPLPFVEVKKQLDEIRAYAGPGANLQITAGEVTLLPVEDLVRIVRYARRDLQLDPMVMTHGQTFMTDPSYLHRLMTDADLQKVSIHMDTTQRGRIGQDKTWTERDVNRIRDRFADLVRDARRITGRPLYAATTYTVTESNLDEIPTVMHWMLRHVDAFRMISFQPTADVGRTRESEQINKRDLIWGRISDALGERINPNTFLMGHEKCNQTALIWVITYGETRRVVQVTRPDKPVDKWFFEQLMAGAFRGFYTDGTSDAELAGMYLGMFLRSPKYFWQWPGYVLYRVLSEYAWLPEMLRAIGRGEAWSVKPLVVVAHNFMSAHELDTPEGQERLDACVFKLPVDGRMVPMCEMNGTDLRKKTNRDTQLLTLRKNPQAA